MTDALPVRCSFVAREAAEGGYSYTRISLGSYHGDGTLRTEHPPVVGDIISLYDANDGPRGPFVVLARSWLHSSWGSTNWSYNEPRPTIGPMLEVLVERSEGFYQDEVYEEEVDHGD